MNRKPDQPDRHLKRDEQKAEVEPVSLCGGIPRPYLYGNESASERWALQNICVEKGRQPSLEERSRLRKRLLG